MLLRLDGNEKSINFFSSEDTHEDHEMHSENFHDL